MWRIHGDLFLVVISIGNVCELEIDFPHLIVTI